MNLNNSKSKSSLKTRHSSLSGDDKNPKIYLQLHIKPLGIVNNKNWCYVNVAIQTMYSLTYLNKLIVDIKSHIKKSFQYNYVFIDLMNRM